MRNGVASKSWGHFNDSFEVSSAAAGASSAGAVNRAVDCPETMKLRRDIGETLVCSCSAEAAADGTVWGTDLYTSDSALCRAALHAGAIGRSGGTVSVQIYAGEPSYQASERNGVSSYPYERYNYSFRVRAAGSGR